MSVSIKYKGNEIAKLAATGTKTLNTAGKYCEGDIVVENTESGGSTSETWVLGEVVSITPTQMFTAEFVSNGATFSVISRVNNQLRYGSTTVGLGGIPVINGWVNQAYRKLTFTAAPTGDLLTWLTGNGTKQEGDLAVQPSKDVTVTENVQVEITPDAPYDVIKKVNLVVEVANE